MSIRTHLWAGGVTVGVTLLAAIVVNVDRAPPVEMLKVRVLDPVVRQGEKIDLTYGYIVKRRCSTSTLKVSIYDQTEMIRLYETPLDESVGTPEDIGPDVYTGILKRIGVPVQSDVGTARLEMTAEFKCNWLHRIWPVRMHLRPIIFKIQPVALIEPSGPAGAAAVQELKQDVQELKEKVDQQQVQPNAPSVNNTAPSSTQTTTTTTTTTPEAKPEVKPEPEPEQEPKPKAKKKKPVIDDDPEEDDDKPKGKAKVKSKVRTQEHSAVAPEPKPKASQDEGDTPAWFNKFLKQIQ